MLRCIPWAIKCRYELGVKPADSLFSPFCPANSRAPAASVTGSTLYGSCAGALLALRRGPHDATLLAIHGTNLSGAIAGVPAGGLQ